MYMSEQESGILSLLASKDVGELAARKRVMELLATKDRDIFDGLKIAQKQVEEDKAAQDRVVKDIGAAIAELKVDKAEVQKKRGLKARLLAEIQQEKAGLEAQYSKLDRESDSIEAQLRAHQQTQGGGSVVFRGRFIRPVNGRITSGYGYRHHPILKRRRLHAGIDFGARTGAPIVAAAAGTVISAGYRGGYGYTVLIDHGSGISTLYGHCSRLFVKSGAKVSQGQRIAAVGSTGLSTGPHLHFEIRVNGKPVNPSSRM
jgi:murein DD-endopeptidase MepM/ murein hydrolase activator NlpD